MSDTNSNKCVLIIVGVLLAGLILGIPLEIFLGSKRSTGIIEESVVIEDFSEYETVEEYDFGDYIAIIGVDKNNQTNLYIIHNENTITITNISYIKDVNIAGNNIYLIGSAEGAYVKILDRSFKTVLDISDIPDNNIKKNFDVLVNDDDTLMVVCDYLYTYDIRGNLIRTINLDNVIAYTNNYYLLVNNGVINLNNINGETISVISDNPLFKDKTLLFNKNGTSLEYKNNRLYLTIINGKMCEKYSFIDNEWLLSESKSC